MKDYRTGKIFCNCSLSMKRDGRHVRIIQSQAVPLKKRCPNCKKNRPVVRRNLSDAENVTRSVVRKMVGSKRFKREYT